MLKNCLYLMFSCLVLSSSLLAEDMTPPLNSMHIIKQNTAHYPNLKDVHSINADSPVCHFENHGLSIHYTDETSFIFDLPENQTIEAGVYNNLMSNYCPCRKGYLSLEVRGYRTDETISDLEIFEIQVDQDNHILSFAADFQVYSVRTSESILKGSIRINSSIPIDEYFSKMIDPVINFQSTNLLYVYMLDAETSKKEELIVNDRRSFDVSLKEDKGLEITIAMPRDKITFHLPRWFDLFGRTSFNIPHYSPKDGYKNPYDFWNAEAFPSPISLTLKTTKIFPKVEAEDGSFTISEFLFDFPNNKVISLAIDFSILNRDGNIFEGVIRYNSTVPVNLTYPSNIAIFD